MDHLAPWQDISETRVPPVDFHLHTGWTDGSNSAREMHDQAVACGLRAVLFSEHARKDSGGWFNDFAAEVRELPGDRCLALTGVETRIDDFNGRLDCSPAIITACDLVMASVHRFPDARGRICEFSAFTREQALETEFRLAYAALDNPDVDILGHPFGMCFSRFRAAPSEEQMLLLIEKAAKNGVAIEINARYHPDPVRLVRLCKERGARISLGSDAHTMAEVGRIVRILRGEVSA